MPNTEANLAEANTPARWGRYKRGGRFTVGASEQGGGVEVSIGTAATDAKAPLLRLVAPKIVEWKDRIFGALGVCVGRADTNVVPRPGLAGLDPEILSSARFDVWTDDPDDLERLGELLSDLGPRLIAQARQMKRRAKRHPLN